MNILSRLFQPSAGLENSRPDQGTHPVRYYYDLIVHMTWREFNLRYRRSVLGVFWSLLLPLMQLMIFVFLFQVVVPLDIEAYPAYVFSGLLPWTWFNGTLGTACMMFIDNRSLLRNPRLSPVILLVVNTTSNLVTFLVGVPLLIITLLVYNITPSWSLLFLPYLLLLQTALIIGLSLILATATVFFRDIQHLTGVTLMMLFYITPVFYRPDSASEQYGWVFLLNPMAVLIEGYRSIFYGQLPSWGSLLAGTLVTLACLVGGYLFYRKQQHTLFDYL